MDAASAAIERATLRLLGCDGLGPGGRSVPQLVVERVAAAGVRAGAAAAVGALVARTRRTLDDVASALADGSLEPPDADDDVDRARGALRRTVAETLAHLARRRGERAELRARFGVALGGRAVVVPGPGFVRRALAATAAGAAELLVGEAELLACEGSTRAIGYGRTRVAVSGTGPSQEDLRDLREALDASDPRGGYVALAVAAGGDAEAEYAVIAALERVDALVDVGDSTHPRVRSYATQIGTLGGVCVPAVFGFATARDPLDFDSPRTWDPFAEAFARSAILR